MLCKQKPRIPSLHQQSCMCRGGGGRTEKGRAKGQRPATRGKINKAKVKEMLAPVSRVILGPQRQQCVSGQGRPSRRDRQGHSKALTVPDGWYIGEDVNKELLWESNLLWLIRIFIHLCQAGLFLFLHEYAWVSLIKFLRLLCLRRLCFGGLPSAVFTCTNSKPFLILLLPCVHIGFALTQGWTRCALLQVGILMLLYMHYKLNGPHYNTMNKVVTC